jgi:hypothetical protein
MKLLALLILPLFLVIGCSEKAMEKPTTEEEKVKTKEELYKEARTFFEENCKPGHLNSLSEGKKRDVLLEQCGKAYEKAMAGGTYSRSKPESFSVGGKK